MTKERQILGRSGEELALEFLQQRGLKLEEKNYRIRSGEIDLVMWHADVLVFVEVRTKSHNHFGEPTETVIRGKRRKIVAVARHFLQNRRISDEVRCRFDLVGVLLRPDCAPQFDYIPDAFRVGD